jgi:hypothetical protein
LNEAEINSHGDRPNTFRHLATHTHIILTGHVHGALEEPDRKSSAARLFKGGSTYAGTNYRNNFSLFQIDLKERWFQRCGFEFDPRFKVWEKADVEHYSLLKQEYKKGPKQKTLLATLDAEIQSYCQKAESLHATLPVAGFVTQLTVPIDIEDIYVPLRAMLDLRGIAGDTFSDAAHAEKMLRGTEQSLEIALRLSFWAILVQERPRI